MKLAGQVAFITGSSRGLGLAIARALAAEGAKIALVARDGAELDAALAALAGEGCEAIAVPADVTRAAEIDRAVQSTIARWGRIDLLVLNAGTWQGAPLHETTEAQWDLLIDLNLKGAFLALHAALPHMIAARRGTIVGIGSINSLVGSAGSGAYAASKWGLRGLLESAALELKPHRIRVSLVYPHNINSAGRAIEPGSADRDRNLEPVEIADAVAFLCSAPDHVSIGHVNVWPLAASIVLKQN